VTLDTLIKNAFDDWAQQAQPAPGLADRALRRRRRRRSLTVGLAAGSTAILLGASAVVISAGGPDRLPAPPTTTPVAMSNDTSLHTDLGNALPRTLIAAGHTAIAAYYTTATSGKGATLTVKRTWYLYDPASGKYDKTAWAYLDVAPGLHQAAVLEGPLPTSRVGILDLATGRITRWIPVDHPVGGVSWAPDGRRLLLTSYAHDPDLVGMPLGTRTGFTVVDADFRLGAFHPLPADGENPNVRQDLGWSRSGTLLWAPTATAPTKVFYSLTGAHRPAPPYEADMVEDAGLSPNGTLLPKFGPAPGPDVTFTNVRTGKVAAILPIEQARFWADDTQLFAIACAEAKCAGKGGEFNNRLVLIDLSGKVTPVTGARRSNAWVPVFTHR
jgi:hypothetical protein